MHKEKTVTRIKIVLYCTEVHNTIVMSYKNTKRSGFGSFESSFLFVHILYTGFYCNHQTHDTFSRYSSGGTVVRYLALLPHSKKNLLANWASVELACSTCASASVSSHRAKFLGQLVTLGMDVSVHSYCI